MDDPGGDEGATEAGEHHRRLSVPTPARATALLHRGEKRAVRFLWVFLPETSIARSRQFHFVLASTFLSDGGRDALKYGALVAVTRSSGSSIDAVLIGVASLLPPTLLGLYGGAVADAFPKRAALAIIYLMQGALCFVVPTFLGTNLGAVIALIFALNVLGEVSTPDEQSVAPLVASDEQLATATSLLSLASNLGTAVGTALLAPILLRVVGVQAVFWAAGTMLLLATTMSVQTFINRRVPLAHQGRMFALQSTVKNGVTIIPLVTLGIAASVAGVDTVLIGSPLLLFGLAFLLIFLSERFSGHAPTPRLEVFESFWRDPKAPQVEPEAGGPS